MFDGLFRAKRQRQYASLIAESVVDGADSPDIRDLVSMAGLDHRKVERELLFLNAFATVVAIQTVVADLKARDRIRREFHRSFVTVMESLGHRGSISQDLDDRLGRYARTSGDPRSRYAPSALGEAFADICGTDDALIATMASGAFTITLQHKLRYVHKCLELIEREINGAL